MDVVLAKLIPWGHSYFLVMYLDYMLAWVVSCSNVLLNRLGNWTAHLQVVVPEGVGYLLRLWKVYVDPGHRTCSAQGRKIRSGSRFSNAETSTHSTRPCAPATHQFAHHTTACPSCARKPRYRD